MASGKLTSLAVRRLKKPGHHGDGLGLYLTIGESGGRSWQFRYRVRGTTKVVWLGLGSERDVTLAEARRKAAECRRMLAQGLDPLTQRRAERAVEKGMTFAEVAERYIAAHETSWRNAKHRQQWRNTLRDYVLPVIGKRSVAEIAVGDVMKIVEPLWSEKPETASRVRGRIEAILDYASARGWRTGDNPARWRGHLAHMLPARDKVARVQHHAALPWREIGGFIERLRKQHGMGAMAAEFAILTAARSGEVRGARWVEIDLANKTWTIPAERMKAGREHRVPLAERALEILHAVAPLRKAADALVFPGQVMRRPLSDVALSQVVKAAGGQETTVHGFRSTFRDWCAEATAYPREVCEAALAHTNRDKTEAAYFRADLFERRRRLMAEWAEFCARPAIAAEVVAIRA
ncbi:MAG: tyrosine-type recombinase/integrase [Acetobacteraceae bacterium]